VGSSRNSRACSNCALMIRVTRLQCSRNGAEEPSTYASDIVRGRGNSTTTSSFVIRGDSGRVSSGRRRDATL
jgi:hypothetical protein